VARDLGPTLHSVRLLAPDLRRLFRNLSPLIEASKQGLPALRDTLAGARPLLGATAPFLSQLNPILQFLELYQRQVSYFIYNGAHALAAKTTSASGGVGHYLRQIGPLGPETVGIFRERSNVDRGNTYLPPNSLWDQPTQSKGIYPNWDCNPSGGPVSKSTATPPGHPPSQGTPACFVAPAVPFQGANQRYPNVNAASYAR
jgi:hypothetical protein